MKSNRYTSSRALCPYYKAQEAQAIHCTGVETGNAIRLSFATPAQRECYSERFCYAQYFLCPLTQMQDRRYEEEENAK